MEVITDVVCPFCGSLCDDLEVVVDNNEILEVRNACQLGAAKVKGRKKAKRILKPIIRKGNQLVETSYEKAAEHAAKILIKAEYPIFYGFGSTDADTHRESTVKN